MAPLFKTTSAFNTDPSVKPAISTASIQCLCQAACRQSLTARNQPINQPAKDTQKSHRSASLVSLIGMDLPLIPISLIVETQAGANAISAPGSTQSINPSQDCANSLFPAASTYTP